MKPSKGLAPHGTSNGADHLDSLVTLIASSLSWVPLSQNLTKSSLNTSLTSWPSVLELSSTNSRQFPLAPGGSCSPQLSLVQRITWPGLSLVTWLLYWFLIGRTGTVEACDWLRAADAPVGTEEEHLPWSLYGNMFQIWSMWFLQIGINAWWCKSSNTFKTHCQNKFIDHPFSWVNWKLQRLHYTL